jgi:hypothetical protein
MHYECRSLWLESRRLKAVNILGGKCSKCNYSKNIDALHFHHLDTTLKKFNLDINSFSKKWSIIINEVNKCVLLCANCHAEEHNRINSIIILKNKNICNEKNCNNKLIGSRKSKFCSKICKRRYFAKNRKKMLKQKLIDYKGGECCKCGYKANNSSLHFHHLDKSTKSFNITAVVKSFDIMKKEADKCILVCGNCHAELHSNNKNDLK